MLSQRRYWARYAWLGGPGANTDAGTLIEITGGRITAVTSAATAPSDATILNGLTIPGMANAHSHAFHRALRGRTHAGKGTFWTWREKMYSLAGSLDPDRYHALARAVYAEMALAGITCVGEFHYLHHDPNGHRYADPNEMGQRMLAAAAEAGIRITLLDTLYLTSNVDGDSLVGVQRRFGDGDLESWLSRVAQLRPGAGALVGLAAHSVRAVPRALLAPIAETANGRPVHIHLSEQRAENEACQAKYGLSPTQLLHAAGMLGPTVTAVHATHLSDVDNRLLGGTSTGVCLCPTTERDLADGIGPARVLANAGAALSLGSDSHAVIDLLEEARAVELDERLREEHRGNFDSAELLTAATVAGHRCLGWADAGLIAPGQRADLVTIRLDSVRTAGFDPANPMAAAVFAATAADISEVIIDGELIVHNGVHRDIPDVAGALAEAIAQVWR